MTVCVCHGVPRLRSPTPTVSYFEIQWGATPRQARDDINCRLRMTEIAGLA